jgi:hypothetical protein
MGKLISKNNKYQAMFQFFLFFSENSVEPEGALTRELKVSKANFNI